MILIIGLPNAGKTTYSQNFNNVIHFDEIPRPYRSSLEYIIEQVKINSNICILGVYGKVKYRKPLCDAAKDKKICIWLDVSLEICIKREQTERKRSGHMVEMVASIFEPPTLLLGWDLIIIIKDNDYEHPQYIRKNS